MPKNFVVYYSDHFPISLGSDGIKWGLSPFRFKDKWSKVHWWNRVRVEGNASYRVDRNLGVVKAEIKK